MQAMMDVTTTSPAAAVAQTDNDGDMMMVRADGADQQQATTSSTQIIDSQHADYINRVAFSPYGRRLATSSGDRFVRVFELTDGNGTNNEWAMVAQWQAHRGAVTSLCWAHPEFGSLLATAGSDHDAKLWEERETTGASASSNVGVGVAGGVPGGVPSSSSSSLHHHTSRWTCKASLTEARRAVTCLEFAPRHWGLKLAVGSADGCVRIYEAVDIMNLAQWPLAATLQAFAEQGGSHHEEEVEGGVDGNYYYYNQGTTKKTASKSLRSSGIRRSKLGVTCLSWCNGRFEPPTLVAGGSHLIVYRYSEAARAWQPLLQLPPPNRGNVLDVAWAPNVGRRFHYIASAENEQLRVYKLLRHSPSVDASSTSSNNAKSSKQQKSGGDATSSTSGTTTTTNKTAEKHLSLDSSQTIDCNAWRCEWNVTGTVLASSGDAGMVQLWKANVAGGVDGQHVFECISKVQGDLSQVATASSSAAAVATDGV